MKNGVALHGDIHILYPYGHHAITEYYIRFKTDFFLRANVAKALSSVGF